MKTLIAAISITFILMFAVLTNPSQDDYVSWAKQEIKNESENMIIGGIASFVGGAFINQITEERDFMLFSIYTTQLGEDDEQPLVTLGIFNNFITVKSPEFE